jgi:hypothetical protein
MRYRIDYERDGVKESYSTDGAKDLMLTYSSLKDKSKKNIIFDLKAFRDDVRFIPDCSRL